MKVTHSQVRVLRFLSEVGEAHRHQAADSRRNTDAVWTSAKNRGLIEFVRWEGRHGVYRITDAGRAALAPFDGRTP